MANEQINQYAVTATSFLAGSFMDIDQLIAPGVWESQKIDFLAMLTQFGNIYNYDGTITEQRTLDGDSKTKALFFIELQAFTVRAVNLEYEADVDIKLISGATGALILPSDLDPSTNVVTPEEFMIKGDSTTNNLLTYLNGTWETIALESNLINIYNTDSALTANRFVDAVGFDLTFENTGTFKVENASSIIFDDSVNVNFLIQRQTVDVFRFTASSATNPTLQIGTLFNEEIVIAAKRGLWLNRADTAKEALVTTPQTGLVLINTDVNRLRYYDGAAWQTIPFATDIVAPPLTDVLTAGFTTADGQVIKALNGGAQLDLRTGANDTWSISSDNGAFAESFVSGHATIFQAGWATVGAGNIFEASSSKVRMKMDPAVADFLSLDSCEVHIKNTGFTSDTNPFKVANTSGAILSPSSTSGTKVLLGNNSSLTTTANVAKSGAFGVTGGDIQDNNTFYFTNVGFIDSDDTFQGVIRRVAITNVDKVYTLPNRDVDFASTSGVQESTTVTSSTGAGAVGITGGRHEINMTAIGNALTLVNGSIGQRLNIVCVSELLAPDTAILTPTTLLGSATTITFEGVGDCVSLEYGTGGWAVISAQGATCA